MVSAVLIIMLILVATCVVGFPIFILLSGMKNVKSIKKNGVEVIATISSIKRVKKRDKNEAVYDDSIEIKCKFEYQGKHELVLRYNYKLDPSKLKQGDKIACVYDPKNDWLSTRDNINASGIFLILPIFIITFIVLLGQIDSQVFDEKIIKIFGVLFATNDIMLIIAFIIWELLAYRLYDRSYAQGKYIKLNGRVTDIHIDYHSGGSDNIGVDLYAPEVSFKYEGKKIERVISRWSSHNKYKRGQEVIVYYNPETDAVYARGNNTFAITMMIMGLLLLIPIIKMFI